MILNHIYRYCVQAANSKMSFSLIPRTLSRALKISSRRISMKQYKARIEISDWNLTENFSHVEIIWLHKILYEQKLHVFQRSISIRKKLELLYSRYFVPMQISFNKRKLYIVTIFWLVLLKIKKVWNNITSFSLFFSISRDKKLYQIILYRIIYNSLSLSFLLYYDSSRHI